MRLGIALLCCFMIAVPMAAWADKASDDAKADRLSKENYDKIQVGVTSPDDAVALLGRSSSWTKNSKDESKTWRVGSNRKEEITVKFHDGVATSKKSTFPWADDSEKAAPATPATPASNRKSAKPPASSKTDAKADYPWTATVDAATPPQLAAKINFTHQAYSAKKVPLTARPMESAVASPLVMIMDIDINTLESGHALDLRTGQEKPLFTGVKLFLDEPQISPDLQYIATKGNSFMSKTDYANITNDITVWDLPHNKQLSKFSSKAGKLGFVKLLGFLNNDQILMSRESTLVISDIHTGQSVREIDVPKHIKLGDKRAFSPSGKYLAGIDDGHLAVIDLASGTVAGLVVIEPTDTSSKGKVFGMAFSPSGKQITIIGDQGGKHWIASVDAATGEVTQNFLGEEFESTTDFMGKHLTGIDVNGHNPIEWLPSGKTIRLNQEILDAATGKVVARITHNDPKSKLRYAKVLSDTTVLVFDETFGAPAKFVTQTLAIKKG